MTTSSCNPDVVDDDPSTAAERALKDYIMEHGNDNTHPTPTPKSWHRIECCGSSRYLYCSDCYRILIPQEDWPLSLVPQKQQQQQQDNTTNNNKTKPLPFQVDVLLDDRRSSSTGVQAVSILRALEESTDKDNNINSSRNDLDFIHHHHHHKANKHSSNVYDIDRQEEIPNYQEDSEGTYLLYPSDDSQPLSSVLLDHHSTTKIRKLVLLDCKWTRSSLRDHPSVLALPKVHLDHPPQTSFYWRWHNAGDGKISTVEALYYAAWQVTSNTSWTEEEQRQSLLPLLWIFSLQRAVIFQKYNTQETVGTNPHLPWTEEAKDFARQLRRKHPNYRKKNHQQQRAEDHEAALPAI